MIYEIIVAIVLILCSLALIAVVLLQPGRSPGLSGAIAGGAETFFGKNKAKSMEGRLAFLTKIFATALLVLSLVLVVIIKLVG